MARRRYSKKRSVRSKSKRKVKRRRTKSKRPFKRSFKRRPQRLSKVAINKAINGVQRYIKEDRSQVLNSAQNGIEWGALSGGNCYPSLSAILSDSGQAGALGSTSDKNVDYYIHSQTRDFHFRNVSNHPAYFTVYEVMFKHDHNIDSATNTLTSCSDFLLGKLHNGWDIDAAAADFDVAGTGAIAQYTAGATTLNSENKLLGPYQSRPFMQSFKILRKSQLKMKPGDDYWYRMRIPNITYKASDWEVHGDLERKEAKRYFTRHLLYKLHGCLGKANNDDTEIGYMTTDIAMEILTRAKVLKMSVTDHQMAISNVLDDLTAQTLEGPTEHSHADEDQ